MDPRDAPRPCMQNRPGCARRAMCPLASMRPGSSRGLEKVTRLRWGHECSAARRDTTHSGHACRASRPNLSRADTTE